jgi:hypothetical protein
MQAPPSGRRPPWLSVLGMVVLSFVLGSAVMFFERPSPVAKFLGDGFMGARSWAERREAASRPATEESPPAVVTQTGKGKPFEGYTLYTCAGGTASGTQAFLIDMKGEVVHKWAVPFSKVWPRPPHIAQPVLDSLVTIFSCHLYPNGDLLAVFHGQEQLTAGYGLAKLDKDSNVLWKYAEHVHHDLDVGEDGTIFAVKHDLAKSMPRGLEHLHLEALLDSLVLLSPEGKELKPPIPIFEALRDSPYAPLFSALEKVEGQNLPAGLNLPRFVNRKQDVLHTNCVQVLTAKQAAKFPQFKAGQVLISMRHLDAIAVLDPDTGKVVWAASGPWQAQHDAQFLDNGHLLLFDNLGLAKRSRVLEYDPQTQAFPWSYAGEGRPFFTSERGMSQRLPNGNTLVVNSEGNEIFEVSAGKEVVWSCSTPSFVCTGRRYSAAEVPFLEGGQRARP